MTDVLRSHVLLVDEQPILRSGLAHVLDRERDLVVAGEAGTAIAALDLVRAASFDLAIVDVLMPDATGISLARAIIAACPSLRVIGLSVLDDPSVIASMLRAGATGYVLKTQSTEHVVTAVRDVLAGRRYLPPLIAAEVVTQLSDERRKASLERLTPREREVFDLLVRGHSNDEIATRLYIARRTVETHRQHIMKKLEVHSLVDVIRVAARAGILCD